MELIFSANSTLLESPVLDKINNLVYCVSIEQNLIYQINYVSGEINTFVTSGSVGCVVLSEDDTLLSAEKSGIYKINTKTKSREYIIHPEQNVNMRYNDGKLDPVGRFIFGTKGDKSDIIGGGKLFSYYNGNYKTLINNITISNGIGFSPNGEKMYFIDTPTKKVAQYSYDIVNGSILFDKYIIKIDGNGYPDGMCVDKNNNLWIAEWEGGRVRKWNIEGDVLDEIILPCSKVTSCCLGDNELFITTAKDSTSGGSLYKTKIK
jgi:sugar lactone lactonase YvrE